MGLDFVEVFAEGGNQVAAQILWIETRRGRISVAHFGCIPAHPLGPVMENILHILPVGRRPAGPDAPLSELLQLAEDALEVVEGAEGLADLKNAVAAGGHPVLVVAFAVQPFGKRLQQQGRQGIAGVGGRSGA